MEERKIRGRSRRRKYKNQMRRPIAVLLALMLSFSSFGTATAYADAAEGSKTESQPEKVESEKWTEKTILDSGKQTDGVSVTKDASANAANEGKETGNDNEGGNDDGQTDGKTDNPYDSIERPAQSDTIEMIPGAPQSWRFRRHRSNHMYSRSFSAPLLRLMKAREYMHLKWFKEGKQVRQMKTLTGAEIVIECLKEQGVDTVFGYPGGAILNIYDALYKHKDEITHILTSHEQGASHAADGYARATGKVGVCMATSGPGATNLVTGIATANLDSIPMVAITCNVTTGLLGKDSFQEIDILGVTMPITKYNFIVKDVTKLADVIRRAFVIAKSGRPGPVLVDITKDVTAAACEYEPKEPQPIERETELIREEDMEKAIEMIKAARKPFIFVGGGAVASDAANELSAFAHKIQAPVGDSLMGKGAFDGTDVLYTGMIGMHGTKTSNLGVAECDLLIVVGARFSDRVVGDPNHFATNAKILHIDIDPAEINKNIQTDASIIGDVKIILRKLNARLDPMNHDEWLSHIERLKDMYPLRYNKEVLTGPYIMEEIYKVTGGDAIICTDVGQHQMWAAQYYKYKRPRQLLTSGGLGTMGYGLGAAIGAKMGCKDKTVINIAGDGCFRMNMNEIATATRYNIPVIEVVFNNHVLGMVRQWQTLFYGKRYSQTELYDQMDFVKVAEGMGAKAYRITKKEDVEPVLREAISLNIPVMIECQIGSDDKVFPFTILFILEMQDR